MNVELYKGEICMQIAGVTNQIDSNNYNNMHRKNPDIINPEIANIDGNSSRNTDERKFTEEELIKSIESANEELIVYDRRLEFSIHEKTKDIMVKVIDASTDEIIREIPPEKILDLAAYLMEISGLIVDEKI